MIPESVKAYLAEVPDAAERKNREGVHDALRILGVDPASEFGEFYLEYEGPFLSPRPLQDLYDLTELSSILGSLDYIRDRYKLGEKFLPLTSDESGGMYLYNKEDGAVYDFYLRDYKPFMAGSIGPRWSSFNQFLQWFFDKSAA